MRTYILILSLIAGLTACSSAVPTKKNQIIMQKISITKLLGDVRQKNQTYWR